MVTIPVPPSDNSGGYMVIQYGNSIDNHRMRVHVRAFNDDGTYVTPPSAGPSSVMAEFTNLIGFIKPFYNSAWVFSFIGLFKNNGDGTFTEKFGFAAPATQTGTGATATPNDQTRAQEAIFNFRDGFGGRMRIILIGPGGIGPLGGKSIVGGNPAGDAYGKLIDYVTTGSKTNIVSHGGHVVQSPATITTAVNRRLRRHYGFA